MRLTAIVCVLLIPILLLSHLTLNNLRREIALTEREATGVLLANLIMPTGDRSCRWLAVAGAGAPTTCRRGTIWPPNLAWPRPLES